MRKNYSLKLLANILSVNNYYLKRGKYQLDGIINIYKYQGWTSSDVVVKLRHILKCKKVGHTGTLDPMAEGVLPICVGRATQLSDYIMDKTKVYEAELVLGITTDTLDQSGNMTSFKETHIDQNELESVLKTFVGEIEQIPPMYSAIKYNGKKLYELARKGEIVERKPRRVTIYSIEIADKINDSHYYIKVHCSKGTYIRSLCADIGEKLGCGACMGELIRIACDNYTQEDSMDLDYVENMVKNNDFSFISDMEKAVMKYPAVEIKPEFAFHFLNGLDAAPNRYLSDKNLSEGEIVRVHVNGNFCAMASVKVGQLHVKNILVDVNEFLGGVNNG